MQALENEHGADQGDQPDGQSIARELRTQYPMLLRVALAKTPLCRPTADFRKVL